MGKLVVVFWVSFFCLEMKLSEIFMVFIVGDLVCKMDVDCFMDGKKDCVCIVNVCFVEEGV